MTTEELERFLEAQGEGQGLDFKGPMEWNVNTFAKDFLAMANVQDGGRIVVGVEDGSWKPVGVSEAQELTFKIDVMRDQMAPLADPYVRFDVDRAQDAQGLRFIVIRIYEFDEIPVLCRKDSADLRAGAFYYRSANRRPESAPVSNSYDLRTILERATVKMMQQKRQLGFRVEEGVQERLEKELGGL